MKIEDIKKCLDDLNKDKIEKLKFIVEKHKKIIILGNGGSSAIASHISQDLTKVLGKQAITFSDASRMTCYMNDFGFENAYCKFIEHFYEKETLVILISSSGNSQNILNAAEFCKEQGLNLVILTGFQNKNKLKTKFEDYSELSFWVDSSDYGVVECTHQIILHTLL